ncbi:MAG: dienelactone hydrolase family protein [Planctomycetota bacterium]
MRMIAMVIAAANTLAAAEIVRTEVEYAHDGVVMKGVLVYDDELVSAGDPKPGIAVFSEWWGRNDYSEQRAEMLAELGYVALAADMYGVGEDGEPRTADDVPGAQALAGELYSDLEVMRGRAAAALDVLRAHELVADGKLGAMGYCLGGTVALELARSGADVQAVVSFHGNLATEMPADAGDIDASVLVCHGAVDPFVPDEQVDAFKAEMESAGVDYQFIAYAGAVHSFTNVAADDYGIPGAGYDEDADRRSWQHMQLVFDEAFADD